MDQRLVDIYTKKLAKTGISYTGTELLQLAKDRKIRPLPTRASVYKFLREEQSPRIQAFSKFVKRPSHYQTVGISKPGVYYIDYGEFHKSWSKTNDNCTGFLVAVENLTNRLFAYPTQGKNTRQWLDSIAKFIEVNRDVNIICSDRDSVATSAKFQQEIEQKYGLKWHFLVKGNKAFLAERYIGYIKVQLSKALASTTSDTDPVEQRWIDFLPEICKSYNSQIVPGTTFKRGTINALNYDRFAEQLFKLTDVASQRYNSFVAGPFQHHDDWNKIIFKFAVGDKVLLAKPANWRLKTSLFFKASQEGNFGKTVFTISGRQLRANQNFDRLIPVYSLEEFNRERYHFYENELVRTSTASSTTAATAATSN